MPPYASYEFQQRNMKSIRTALLVVILLQVIVTGTLSCSRPTNPTPQPGNNSTSSPDVATYGDLDSLDPRGQVVVYWHDFAGVDEESMLALVDEFNRTNEWQITVLAESQGTRKQLLDRLNRGLTEKKIPGIVIASPNQALTYARLGAVVSLEPYVESEKWGYSRQELGDFFPASLSGNYVPELPGRYGWPVQQDMEILLENQDWLIELGYDKPPQTWEEFTEVSCAAPKQPFSNAKQEGILTGFRYSPTARQFATLLFSRGGNITSKDRSGFSFNTAESQATLQLLQELENRGCAELTTDKEDGPTSFGQGRTLFTIASVRQLPRYQEAIDRGAGFEWTVLPLPHTTQSPRMNVFGSGLSILRSTPRNQLSAWLFLKWISEPAQQAKWATGTGHLPVRRSAKSFMTDYLEANPAYADALKYVVYGNSSQVPVVGYEQCERLIQEMVTVVVAGTDIPTALNSTVEQCQLLLN